MASANVANTLIVPAASKVAPYYDDFDESKNFYRLLFRPGYAVQARELTQLQTILQNQIERFGRHIFVNGSSVIGGKVDISDVITLNVVTQYANTDIDIGAFKDKTIVYSSGNTEVQARVLETSPSINGAPACLHVKYITGTEFGNSTTIMTTSGNLYANLVSTSDMSSNGTVAFIYDSIYFMQGFFVKVPKQSVVVSKHDRLADCKVGLEVVDDILTEYNDASLLDPAQESSNYQAPGATRYQVNLNLAKRDLDSIDDEKWIEIARLNKGVITKLQTTPLYSEIEEVLARRTYDESGNYIVKPFKITVENSTVDSANNFTLAIGPGKAYVFGYEAENQSTTNIEIPRARETKTTLNYPVKMNYGNYFIVENLKGNFNTNRQGLVDLHCVIHDDINMANSTTYNSTKVGTARVKDIGYYGAANPSNTTSRQYEFYFYDNKFTSIKGNASSLSSNTNQIVINSANASSANDAYTGAYIKILAGNSAGDLRYITGYNGLTKTANVSVAFTTTTNTNSNYEIRFDITDVDSVYQSTSYTGGANSNAAASISLVNKDDGTYNGNTFISEPTFSDSFFSYPSSYIAPGIANVSYVYRRVYNSVNFTSGLATLTSAVNETFEVSTSTSNVSSAILDNLLVIVTNPTGSSRTIGDQVKITTVVNTSTPQTAQLNTSNTLESFTATVYAKMLIDNPPARVKSLVTANTTYLSSSSPSAMFTNPSGSNTKVYLSTGQVVIKDPSANTESLFITDVADVAKIYYSSTEVVAGDSLTGLVDVTTNFTVDRGHRNEYYDHASIKIKSGIPLKKGYYIVCCRYYSHTTDTGFFTVDSYPSLDTTVTEEGRDLTTGYALIPVVNGFRISDQIDFRPSRSNASNTDSWTFNTARTPVADTNFISDFSFYVERRDIIVMNVNDELRLVSGNINSKQNYPSSPSRSLLLHRLRVLPYTVNKSDIIIETVDHRRYTMSDIGSIDKRLKLIEYTTTLNALEKSASDIIIKDVNGLDRTKYGILAEDFSSHLLGDTTNPDYSCAVDVTGTFSPTGGILMPRVVSNYIKLEANTATSTNLSVFEDKITLAFRTAPAITQGAATKSVSLSDYLFAEFRGHIITSPESDQWKDITYLPPEVVSLPQPTIQFDITATDITNITNTTNTTNINNVVNKYDTTNITHNKTDITNVTEVYEEVVQQPPEQVVVERLLIATSGGYLNYFLPLNWSKQDGFSSQYSLYPPDTDESGKANTVGMNSRQFHLIICKLIDSSGYPGGHGTIGVCPQHSDIVYGLYLMILNRPPDPAGCAFWTVMLVANFWTMQKLREEMTKAAVLTGELSVGTSVGWSVSASGVNLTPKYLLDSNMVASLATNKSVDITLAGSNSYETTKTPDGRIQTIGSGGFADDVLINGFYETYLGRKADPSGLKYWQNTFKEWESEFGRKEAADKLEAAFKNSEERRKLDADRQGYFTSTII